MISREQIKSLNSCAGFAVVLSTPRIRVCVFAYAAVRIPKLFARDACFDGYILQFTSKSLAAIPRRMHRISAELRS